MQDRPTRKEKNFITQETIRCLDAIDEIFNKTEGLTPEEEDLMSDLSYDIKNIIVKGQPYIKYNEHLLERINE